MTDILTLNIIIIIFTSTNLTIITIAATIVTAATTISSAVPADTAGS